MFVLTFSFLLTISSFASQHIGTDDRGTTITGITATGSGTNYSATTAYDNEFSIDDPTRTGYTFDGWTVLNTDASVMTLKNKTKSDGKFTGVKGLTNIKNLSTMQDDNVTVKAVWTPVTYTITYDLDGGNLSGQKTSYTVETESFTLPPPTKEGYTFLGWTGSNGTTLQTTVTVSQGSTGDLSYTANWEAPLVDLTFTGVNSDYWGNIKYGTTNEQTTSTKTYKVPAGSTVKLYGKISNYPLYLYAYSGGTITWEPTGQSATNGNYVNGGNSVANVNGVQFVMPSSALSLYLSGNSYSVYDHFGVYVDSGSVNLWPLSDEPFYSISYDLDGGNINNPRNEYMPTYSNYTLPTPTKDGYTFLGWTGSNGETPQTTVTIPANTIGNLSYIAHWEQNPLVDLTITYIENSYWGNIKYSTTDEQVTLKTYKVPAGSLVKLYGKIGSRSLYLYNNALGQTSYNGTKAVTCSNGYYYNNNSSITTTGVQFVMPDSALSLSLNYYYGSGDSYNVGVSSGSVVLNVLEE